MNFEDKLDMGRRFEQWVATQLAADGWTVIPLAELPAIGGRGPRARDTGTGLILPDLQGTKHGRTVAIECKAKDHAEPGKLSGELEQGIDLGAFDAYLEYERRTGIATFLVVGERQPAFTVRIARISQLRPRISNDGRLATPPQPLRVPGQQCCHAQGIYPLTSRQDDVDALALGAA